MVDACNIILIFCLYSIAVEKSPGLNCTNSAVLSKIYFIIQDTDTRYKTLFKLGMVI